MNGYGWYFKRTANWAQVMLAGIILLGGCTITNTLEIKPDVNDLPAPEKVPMRMGSFPLAAVREGWNCGR